MEKGEEEEDEEEDRSRKAQMRFCGQGGKFTGSCDTVSTIVVAYFSMSCTHNVRFVDR